MSKANTTTEFFDTLARILARCTIFGFLLLLFWFGAVMLAEDLVYGVHAGMFGMSFDQLRIVHYCGMGLLKLFIGCFFVLPWIAIRLVLK